MIENVETVVTVTSPFAKDTLLGLSAQPKFLYSKYMYDDMGSRLFQQIMQMPEYYLTDCEYEILDQQTREIRHTFAGNGQEFDLIELGAGDGLKTKVLMAHLLEQQANFKYIPIDISEKATRELVTSLESQFPDLVVEERVGDYFQMIRALNQVDFNRKIILFLGSNIGNYDDQQCHDFFQGLADVMNKNDMLFIGFDLKKDPAVIMEAYNDPHGYTRRFNLNHLLRINRELDGNFDLENFIHHETYNPVDGVAKSHLLSTREHTVTLNALQKQFHFKEYEPIVMEMSRKYDLETIHRLATLNGFKIVENFFDKRRYFVDSVWQLNS